MFCSSCGGKAIEGAPFCHLCGARVTDSGSLRPATPTTNSGNSKDTRAVAEPSGSGPPMMTFTEFRSVKENQRQSHFKTSNKKRKTEDNNASKMVNIKIGMMTYREDHGGLKIVRGGHHGISVSPSSGAKDLRVKAVEKHSRFNRKLSDCADLYILLYPDTIPVEKIPGTEEDFTLQRYKQELGKPFDRITLYLCQTRDYLVNQGYVSSGTDSDGDLKTVQGKQGLTDRASASKCNQGNECSDKASTSTCKQGNESNSKSRSQKLYKCHLPQNYCPKGCRYIAVYRNPCSVAYSFYKFLAGTICPDNMSMDEFVTGTWLTLGDPANITSPIDVSYVTHLLDWMVHRNDPNVLILFYEEMKEDLEAVVRAVASFLSVHDEQKIRIAVEKSSFEFMKSNGPKFNEKPLKSGFEALQNIRTGSADEALEVLSQDIKAVIQQRWEKEISKVTGYNTYEELRRGIRKERPLAY